MKNLVIAVLGLMVLVASNVDAARLNKNIRVTTASNPSDDFETVNGNVTVEDGVQLDSTSEVSSVNGSVRVGSTAQVGDVETVNGSVKLGDYTRAENVSTVNGSIRLGKNVAVAGNVESVNGSLTAKSASTISGNMENVNGRITVEGAQVSGSVTNYNGGMLITDGAVIGGDIRVKKPRRNGWSRDSRKKPKIVIGPNVRVSGEMVFEQEVNLYIHDSASVGSITGAEAISFSGDRPERDRD